MKRFPVVGIALAAMVAAGSHAQGLTQQQGQLATIGQGFSQQAMVFEGLMNNELTELANELKRGDRLDTEASAAEAAKNILTMEQKLHMLSQLNPQETLPHKTIESMQPDIFDLPLNLTLNQRKQLVALKAALRVKEIETDRDVELVLLDLEAILLSGESKPASVDPLVMNLASLAAREIDNRITFSLKAKDVLTLDQKRMLAYLMELNQTGFRLAGL